MQENFSPHCYDWIDKNIVTMCDKWRNLHYDIKVHDD
jgi:hypothetical protein